MSALGGKRHQEVRTDGKAVRQPCSRQTSKIGITQTIPLGMYRYLNAAFGFGIVDALYPNTLEQL
jgi:hypothetical protein